MSGTHSPQAQSSLEVRGKVGLLLIFLVLSLWISLTRVYQVDEAQNAYMAWLMGARPPGNFYMSAPLFLAPLAWLSRFSGSAETVFLQARLLFWVLFWVNLVLLVKGAGLRLRSRAGGWTLLAIALLPPLWTYGLEVRHENAILCGLLSLWVVGRRCIAKPWAFLALGLLSCFMQLCAFKAIAYWAPLTFILLLLPPPQSLLSGRRRILHWIAGFGIGCFVGAGIHLAMGTLHAYLLDQIALFHATTRVVRFAPWSAASKFLTQAPLLVALLVIPAAAFMAQSIRASWRRSSWDGPLPEILLWSWTCLLLVVNPNPFPYNLLTVTACGSLAVIAMQRHALPGGLLANGNRTLLVSLLLFAQGVPFATQIFRLLSATNDRQVQLMSWTERLTDPASDTVFDGAGLVPTRRSPMSMWFVNLTNLDGFRGSLGGTLDQVILRDAPPVLIPTYRFNSLTREDLEAVQQNYLGLAPDLLVLGRDLHQGAQVWECRHPGRYALVLGASTPSEGTFEVDGHSISPGIYSFRAGSHNLLVPSAGRARVEWVGPTLQAPFRPQGEDALPGVFPIPNSF